MTTHSPMLADVIHHINGMKPIKCSTPARMSINKGYDAYIHAHPEMNHIEESVNSMRALGIPITVDTSLPWYVLARIYNDKGELIDQICYEDH